jgi:thiol-disulfide isomerase/thioredoxin
MIMNHIKFVCTISVITILFYLSAADAFLSRRSIMRSRNVFSKFQASDNDVTDPLTEDFEIVSGSSSKIMDYDNLIEAEKRSNKIVAFASSLFAAIAFAYNNLQPSSGVMLLHAMERDSVPIQTAVCNGKPTLIDFYADWCESCKAMAPTMRAMEKQYGDRVNFITINGVDPKNYEIVRKFKVDGIPQTSFLAGGTNEVKTTLVGAVPKGIMKNEIMALVEGSDLPYIGYDIFGASESHLPFSDTSKMCGTTANTDFSVSAPRSDTSSGISDELRNLLLSKSVIEILNGDLVE